MRKPTPPPKVPPLVRRGVAAAALGLGVGGVACGGSVDRTPSAKSATDASDPGDAGIQSDGPLEAESGPWVSTDAAAAEDSAIQDAGTDAPRIRPPPLPPK